MPRKLSDIQVDATDSVLLGKFKAAVMSYCAEAIEAAEKGAASADSVRTVLLENSAQRYAVAVMCIVVARVQAAPSDLTDAQIQQAVVRLMPKLLG